MKELKNEIQQIYQLLPADSKIGSVKTVKPYLPIFISDIRPSVEVRNQPKYLTVLLLQVLQRNTDNYFTGSRYETAYLSKNPFSAITDVTHVDTIRNATKDPDAVLLVKLSNTLINFMKSSVDEALK